MNLHFLYIELYRHNSSLFDQLLYVSVYIYVCIYIYLEEINPSKIRCIFAHT